MVGVLYPASASMAQLELPLRLNETQTSVFGGMGETPVGEGGGLMTALAEGELAKAAPPRFAESIPPKTTLLLN